MNSDKTPRPTAREVVDDMDLAGRTCVITGASSGLGLESARALAHAGAHVILTARRGDALVAAEARIRRDTPAAQVSTVTLDLASLAGIREGAAAIAETAPAVHALINNAGIMFTPFAHTTDGFELQLGTNHLGHFELTRLLTPQLRAAQGARVVILASEGHRLGDIDFTDPQWDRRDYDKFRAYGSSKTANILHAVELNRRLRDEGIRTFAVHPGMVATALARHMNQEDIITVTARSADIAMEGPHELEILTPEQGAATPVWAAVHPEPADLDGVYFADCSVRADVEPYAVDSERAEQLWELSEQLCSVPQR